MKLLKEMNQRTEAEKNGRILSDNNKWHGLLSPGECSILFGFDTFGNTKRLSRVGLLHANTHRCRSRQIFRSAKYLCPNFPKLAQKMTHRKRLDFI